MRDDPVVKFEDLTAIGYAFGWDQALVLDVKVLLVSKAPVDNDTPGIIVRPGYIGGMSGGPVVDMNGQMVGIVQQANSGVGYGVPILIIRAFLLGH